MQGFKGEVHDCNVKERAHHTHQRCVLHWQKEEKKRKRMLNKASINDDGDHNHHQQQQQHVVIGDILLHSDSKTAIIQVVIHSLKTSSLTSDKPIIHRQSTNSSGINNSQAIVPCDLKNISPIKVTQEQVKSSSSKKLIRIQKAGMALVKDFKLKVIHTNQSEPKINTKNTNSDIEQTYF